MAPDYCWTSLGILLLKMSVHVSQSNALQWRARITFHRYVKDKTIQTTTTAKTKPAPPNIAPFLTSKPSDAL